MPANETLVAALTDDRLALQRLLCDCYDGLLRHIQMKLRGPLAETLASEDILQETFVMAIRDIGHCRAQSQSSFAAWLSAIADNRIRDLRKHAQRAKRGGGNQPLGQVEARGSSRANLVELYADSQTSPSSKFGRREMESAIQVGIAMLPDDQRRAVVLRFLAGHSLEQVALEMEKSPAAVRGLLHRGKQALKQSLGESSRWFAIR